MMIFQNPVNKNDYLGEYTGELISHREADKRGKIYDRANSSFLFDLNDQVSHIFYIFLLSCIIVSLYFCYCCQHSLFGQISFMASYNKLGLQSNLDLKAAFCFLTVRS